MRFHRTARSAIVRVFSAIAAALPLICAFPSMLPGFTAEELNTISVYEAVAPSVVNITTMACDPEFFFCAVPSSTGSGSGIVLKAEGIIVTNHHVVASARDIYVTMADNRNLEAKVIASSPRYDLAVIRVDVGDKPLKEIVLGNSDNLRVGEKVLAIGNPFGLGGTLTTGVVSMTGRDIKNGGRVMEDLIQTDASINPGNSGGALVNSSGELVGINTMILSPTGSNIGIGFAIPVNRVKEVTPGLMHGWDRLMGWLLVLIILLWIYGRIRRV